MILQINQRAYAVNSPPDTPLLWVLRDELQLTGTKYGCGIAACGACTVLINDQPVRSCSLPLGSVAANARIQTIEGLANPETGALHPVQQAWLDNAVPQCGYCQSGMVLSTVALLKNKPNADRNDIEAGVSNLCRCGTYPRVIRAIESMTGKAGGAA